MHLSIHINSSSVEISAEDTSDIYISTGLQSDRRLVRVSDDMYAPCRPELISLDRFEHTPEGHVKIKVEGLSYGRYVCSVDGQHVSVNICWRAITRAEINKQQRYTDSPCVDLGVWLGWAREIAHDANLGEYERSHLLAHMLDCTPSSDPAHSYISEHFHEARQEYEILCGDTGPHSHRWTSLVA